MRPCDLLPLLSILAILAIGDLAAPAPRFVEPEGMDLSLDGMQISDPEHTAEYLAKTGGRSEARRIS
jgi:hypothetical protein